MLTPADVAAGSTPQQTDIPNVRTLALSQQNPIAPLKGYQGCLVLLKDPLIATQLNIALYVDKLMGIANADGSLIPDSGPGVTWEPPAGAVIMDVPRCFAINSPAAILYWLQREAAGDGKPPPTGSVGGET